MKAIQYRVYVIDEQTEILNVSIYGMDHPLYIRGNDEEKEKEILKYWNDLELFLTAYVADEGPLYKWQLLQEIKITEEITNYYFGNQQNEA